ncbi:MAG TPA: LytR C-terminal domain-containing protein [Solirubrobacteraceae bacterium]|nr:LytR C-terminal domain-containing protein [Solirubrobacteraceae bacterium]
MASIPFALSVHHFISSVGADAGFAALIGLALLVLLYFAHARETATLRSRADEAGLRVQELEAQLAELADQVAALPAAISVRAAGPRVAAAPGGVQQRVAAGVGAGYGLLPPSAPAGVGAPALAAATRLIPMPEVPTAEPEPEPVAATVAGGNGSSRIPVATAAAGTVQRPVQAPGGTPPRPPAGPGRAAGGAGRPGGTITGQPRPAGAQPRPGAGQQRPGGAGRTGGPNYPMRPAPRRSRTGRMIGAILVAAVGVAAVVAAVLVLTNKGSSSTASKSSSALSSSLASSRTRSRTVLVQPSKVTVSVLNGTDLNGLAARVASRLAAEGFREGAITNAANQTQTTSIVAYVAPAYRADALAVASTLKLGAASVQAVGGGTKQIACSNSPLGCNSAVYVTVGSDLANQ